MIKVIIISYFYPPSSFVGGERTAAWAKHLNESGIYPIVITRAWNDNQKDLIDPIDQNELLIEKTDSYEIRRLPYRRSLRDRLSKYPRLRFFQKALTFKELILSNYFIRSLPYFNFYSEAKNLLKTEDVKAVIASGRPFQSFFIGHRLKKEFDMLWIPDYRDEWTTHKHLDDQGGVHKWITKLERKSELKWTSNADFFLSVSDNWVKIISELIGKEGKVVLNGYNELITNRIDNTRKDQFVITYAGTLYPSQNINLVLNSCIALIDEGKSIFIRFIGANMMPKETSRILTLLKGYESHFEFLDRMPKSDLDGYMNQTDLLFLTSFENIKGWYPVKLFEYYASGIPLLLCPSDEDCMERFVKTTNAGFVANSEEDCKKVLLESIHQKDTSGKVLLDRSIAVGNQYSRKSQTKVLAEILKFELAKLN